MAQRQASNIPPSGPPFSKRKKLFITTTAMWVTWNSNLGSSLPSNAATAIQVDLSIARGPLVWLNSLYMLGYAVGPLLFGPLSEHIGRRPVILYAYAGYMLCTMARRARAAGEAVPGSSEKSLAAELRIVFTRPAVMMVREPIVLWTALYLALVYSILYLFFQAYPVIFQGVYDLSPGMIGLGYLPILAGILLALAGVFLYDAQLARYQARGSRWASDETHRRLPLAYIGGPLCVSDPRPPPFLVGHVCRASVKHCKHQTR
ncbi:Putative cation-transporting ATPase 1 [Verticillium dahliae VDG1]|nr:Putative cation-transporting ATPase 1 [Verticillium dahliae VDG1]